MHPDAVRLARLYALRRVQGQAALSLDGYERWGNGSRYDELEAHQALAADIPETEATMRALAASMPPEARAAFAEARIALLDAFLETTSDDTATYVAREEREAWAAFGRGEKDLVHQNPYYVHLDPERIEALFGFDPRTVA